MDDLDYMLPANCPNPYFDSWDRHNSIAFSATKGLRNAPGENNCFVNCAVQVRMLLDFWLTCIWYNISMMLSASLLLEQYAKSTKQKLFKFIDTDHHEIKPSPVQLRGESVEITLLNQEQNALSLQVWNKWGRNFGIVTWRKECKHSFVTRKLQWCKQEVNLLRTV